jgi:hypothetical protein
MNLVPLLVLGRLGGAVRAELNISAVLQKYPVFEGSFFMFSKAKKIQI